MEFAPFKTLKELDISLTELWNNNKIDNTKLYVKANIQATEEMSPTDGIIITNTKLESYQIGVGDEILWNLSTKFNLSSLDKFIEKWKKKKIRKRLLTDKQIFECYDKFGEKLSVISFRRNTKEKIMADRNVNVFRALREFSMRNTMQTLSVLCLDLPENIDKFEDVLKYELSIDDFYYGISRPKNNNLSIEEKKEDIIDDVNDFSDENIT